jgi:hypothetical protein
MNQNTSFGVNWSSSPRWLIGQRLIAWSTFGVIAKSLLDSSFDWGCQFLSQNIVKGSTFYILLISSKIESNILI